MSSPQRRRRTVNKLAISAAAVAVCVFPTACDYSLASPPSVGSPTSPSVGGGGEVTTAPVVVPVGNSTDGTRVRDRDRDRDNGRGRGTRTRTRPPTIPVGTPGQTTAPTESPAPGQPGQPGEPTVTTDATATTDPAATTTTAPATVAPPAGPNNGLDILGRDCTSSKLAPHDGFQKSPACVSTAMGEVAAEDKLPSLLITAAPKNVAVDQTFMLEVSTRNLVRDRFLGAAAGGYYLESSFLNGAGLQRGHFHTACRILGSTSAAPDSSKTPEFFLATQDNGGGAAPDTVTIEVPGIKTAGELQCTSWAGDGSHRTPMMTRANQTPAIDSVRITVGGANAPAGAAAPQADVNDADAVQDANKQAAAQAEEAQQQKPDQDGAPQPGADSTLPGGAAAGDAGNQNAGDAAEPDAGQDAGADQGAGDADGQAGDAGADQEAGGN